ncbi:Cmx/CmrA family chloramphenicol efflux MFS transporter [Streptomyces sp. NBC_01176]|uniref:Cmx/CmrA family chloramphenicol efflux MFS transporter n=1 Tax=Streptomyces sp. NBC_01176 TaxID=2903760 RepID=UPI0038685686
MPFVIYVLGLGIFAQGTSEFMLAGVMPSIAQDLDIPLASAGMLVSAFAIGMLVGAPLMSLVTLKMPRRVALVGFQLVFIAAHVGAALVPHFGFLLVMRVLSAMACAGFWAMASVSAISLVDADQQGRAMGVVVSGLSVATIIGVPGGTLLAQHAGWEAAFWAVAAMTALSTMALLIALPGGQDTTTAQPRVATELRSLTQPRLWVAYATTALTVAAQFAVFSYLGALLEDVTGLSTGLVPLVLGLYGVGAFLGLTIGGRVADRSPFTLLLVGMAAFIVAASALAVTAQVAWVTITLVVLLGAANFGVTPAVNARVFAILGETRTLGGAVNIAAFNVGIAVAPLASGLVINTGLGLAGTAWIGAAFGVAHMGSVLLDRHLTRRHAAGTASSDDPGMTTRSGPEPARPGFLP